MILNIPHAAITYELQNRLVWFGEEGIMFAIPKPRYTRQTKEDVIQEIKTLQEIIGKRKVCIVGEADKNAEAPTKGVRSFLASELNQLFKAMAIITSSPLSKMVANIFFALNPPAYPIKMFTKEKEALDWIRQFNK